MKNWYNTLTPRERALVLYGGILALLVLFSMLVAKPLYNNHQRLNKVISSQKKTLQTMQKQSVQIKQLQQQKKKPEASGGSGNPQRLVERSLQTWRLKPMLERMQSQGSNGVRLSLKNANADRVMRFLYELEDKHTLSISNFVINNNKKEAGFADVRLTITRN